MQAKTELDVILAEKAEAEKKIKDAADKLTTPEERKKLAMEQADSNLEELKKQQAQAKQALDDAEKALQASVGSDAVTIQQAKDAKSAAIDKYEEITKKVKQAQALVDKRNKKEEKKKQQIESISVASTALEQARKAEVNAAIELIKARRSIRQEEKKTKNKDQRKTRKIRN